uniref:CCHC-type domain-containing protein n=1 Tax=Xenopus tropicalis TaxID=8364 RepID=A0A6I8SSG9_XENTR
MITLKGELFEVEVSIERLLTKAGPWRERFENMERFEKMQKSLKGQVPYRTRKPSTTSCSTSSDTEGEFKKPEAPSRSSRRAPPKGQGSETINWQHMVFDLKDVPKQGKKREGMKQRPQVTSVAPDSFHFTQEEFPPLSPATKPREPSQSQRPQEDVTPAMEVSSNQSAASGVSGVVHGDESGVNAGVSVAALGEASAHSDPVVMGAQEVLVVGNKESGNTGPTKAQQAHVTEGQTSTEQASTSGVGPKASTSGVGPKALSSGGDPKSTSGVDPKASGRFWERRRFFPAGEGPSFGGQAFRRKNCVKLMWEGNKEDAPNRTYIIRRLLEGSAKFKASTDLEACIVQSPTEWDVSFKIPQGLDAFWRLFETLKTQPEWQNFEAMPISKPEIKNITIIVKNEGVPVDDVLTWLKRQCTVLSPLVRVLEDDVWTGGWKTEVKLTVVNNVPQHLPNTFFIGKEKCICFYAGQAKRCFKCGSLNHLASSCAVEKCILCGKIGHTKKFCKDIKCNLCGNMGHPHRLCPMASHNKNKNILVVENQLLQEEDQLLIEAVHEIENQQREEQQQRHEGTTPNQPQQRETGEDQDGIGRKVQHQRGQTHTHREVDQRSSPQPCPSSAIKGLSQTVIDPIISPEPNPQTHPPDTVIPESTQHNSETPVSISEESPYKRGKKKKKGKFKQSLQKSQTPSEEQWQVVGGGF